MMILFTAVFVMLVCFVVISIMGFVYERKWTKNFEVEVAFSEEQAGEGDTLYLYETITNHKDMILPAVCVKFKASRYLKFDDMDGGSVSDYYYRNDVLSVRGFEKVRRKLKLKCMRRGEYSIDEAEVVGNDYFLRRRYVDKKEVSTKLTVYPSFVGIEKIVPVFKKSYGELSTKIPLFEDPFEYIGVREYMPGDGMNRINWKASAKTGRWQVRTSAYTASEPAYVFLNLESPGAFTNQAAMEENIRIAYSLVYYLDSRGITTTLISNGGEGLCLSGNGRDYIASVRRHLAGIYYDKLIRSGEQMLRHEFKGFNENCHVFFVSAAGKAGIQNELIKIAGSGISVTWVATVFGGEDDTKELLPALEKCIFRWRG